MLLKSQAHSCHINILKTMSSCLICAFLAEHCNVVKKIISFLKDCTVKNKTVGVCTVKLPAEFVVSTDIFYSVS